MTQSATSKLRSGICEKSHPKSSEKSTDCLFRCGNNGAIVGKRGPKRNQHHLDLQKRHNIQLSAGTVYPVLYALERDGNIRRLPNRRKKLYVLTSKGKETINSLQENVGNLSNLITELTKNNT
jgi:hypothetical protein